MTHRENEENMGNKEKSEPSVGRQNLLFLSAIATKSSKSIVAVTLCLLLILGSFAGCSGKPVDPAGDKAGVATDIAFAKSYGEVAKLLEGVEAEYGRMSDGSKQVLFDEAMPMAESVDMKNSTGMDTATGADSAPTANGDGGNYSGTNVQVEGIDEGDIVKTDGKYIYILRDNNLIIVKAEGDGTSVVSKTQVCKDQGSGLTTPMNKEGYQTDSNEYLTEMYVSGEYLAVISQFSSYTYAMTLDGAVGGALPYGKMIPGPSANENYTKLYIYDISDPAAPKLTHELGQDGNSISSRLVGDTVYLLTSYYVYDFDSTKDQTFIPALYKDGKKELIPYSCIAIMPEVKSMSYTIISSYSLKSGESTSNQTVLSGGDTVYMNHDNLYLASSVYSEEASSPRKESIYEVIDYTNKSTTDIMRFALAEGKVALAAHAAVPGYLESQFSMDEFEDNLRLVTTVDEESYSTYTDKANEWVNYKYGDDKMENCLYVLGPTLEILGKIEGLAEDERIYSARFDGKIGYFVTFRQVDPLFAVDLSDPSAPKILSELKIPGFSEYLHVYGEGRLFGLGYDADANTGRTEGMKMTMFDTSDPADVREYKTLKLDSNYSEALYNHKAILIVPKKDLIGFQGDEGYSIYGYSDEKGFYLRATVDSSSWGGDFRGMYIGDYIYIVAPGDGRITVLNMEGFGEIARVAL